MDEWRVGGNELCVLLANVSPFDEILTEARDRAADGTKVNTMSEHLKKISESEAFSAAKESGSCEDLLAFMDQLDVTMRDVPKTNPNEIVLALNAVLGDAAHLCDPIVLKCQSHFTSASASVIEALKGTEDSGPVEATWKLIKPSCMFGVALQKAHATVAGICKRVAIDPPQSLTQHEHVLQRSMAFSTLHEAVSKLISIREKIPGDRR